jgi:hypothetical protein
LSGNVEARHEAHGLLPEMKLNGEAEEALPTQEGSIEISAINIQITTGRRINSDALVDPCLRARQIFRCTNHLAVFKQKNTPQIFYLIVAASEILLSI